MLKLGSGLRVHPIRRLSARPGSVTYNTLTQECTAISPACASPDKVDNSVMKCDFSPNPLCAWMAETSCATAGTA